MTGDELLQVRNSRPFEPFRIGMSDGTGYDVTSPEFFVVGETASYLAIPSLSRPELAHHLIRLSNDHITQIWPLEGARERERQTQG